MAFGGGKNVEEYHPNAEYYDKIKNEWIEISSFPYSDRIQHFATLYRAGSFYIFGGFNDHASNKIVRLEASKWLWSVVVGSLQIFTTGLKLITLNYTINNGFLYVD